MDPVVEYRVALQDDAGGAQGVGELGYMVIFHTVPLSPGTIATAADNENISRTQPASSWR